ncbi:Vps51/Vps67-domain-containing protein [Annulohypoxylon maeteangense]|uniref:Vps51/Vps67-domain-containing protein n=1 Tax=Annulohypoxylon maeteangense TaxID=1927788 RepID=UPI0020087F33|nr:Vps51/Vps67-domain-containing protein [Annulohypoxylon maeteangense]KAI0886691.1 Vps51/Vps67-domain-containing protein [Annulohypoxylon maeteangense]
MSTIATPRDPPRRVPSYQGTTPTSSTRPSLDASRSPIGSPKLTGSPNLSASAAPPTAPGSKSNRAALRAYYNLKKQAAPVVEVTDPFGETSGGPQHEQYSEVAPSEMDKPDFDAESFVKKALAENGMEELLRLYTRVLGETRALDAEKKALVYDNYSKLITATETIRKMRTNMDPLNPMASTLDPAIAQIYSQASAIRDSLRKSVPPPDAARTAAEEARKRKARTKQLATEVLDAPDKIRALVNEGRLEDARQAWKMPRRLLLVWKEQGVGGIDVDACIEDGDAALKGEPSKGNWRDVNGNDS